MRRTAGAARMSALVLVMVAASACGSGEISGGAGGDGVGASASAKTDEEYIAEMRAANKALAGSTDKKVEDVAQTFCRDISKTSPDGYMNAILFGLQEDPEFLRTAVLAGVRWKCPRYEAGIEAWEPRA